MFVKSDQEITDEHSVSWLERSPHSQQTWKHEHGNMMETKSLVIFLRYKHPIFVSLSVHLEQIDITRYLVPYCSVDAYKFAFSPSGIRLWNSLPTETVSVQFLESLGLGLG